MFLFGHNVIVLCRIAVLLCVMYVCVLLHIFVLFLHVLYLATFWRNKRSRLINRARRRVTTFIETNVLPLSQTGNA